MTSIELSKLKNSLTKYNLSENERVAMQAECNRLVELRDKTRNALGGALLNPSQREACKKALPVLEHKVKLLNEKLIADRLLRDCDECKIPKHYQDRPT